MSPTTCGAPGGYKEAKGWQVATKSQALAIPVSGPCLDLSLSLGDELLQGFCDHVPPDPSFDAN